MNPEQSPLGNFPELAKAYASTLAQGGQQLAGAAPAFNTGVQVENEEANRKASIQKQIQDLEAMTDPNAYRKVRKEDGGFDFFDPQGNQVDIATLTERTGTNALDWVADSENPIDVQYANDYSNLQDFMNAVLSKDKDKVDQYTETDPRLKRYTAGRGGIDKLLQDFKRSYQRYYRTRQEDPRAWGQAPSRVVVPTAQSGGGYGLGGGGGI